MKGVSSKHNKFDVDDYLGALKSPISGVNRCIQLDRSSKEMVYKMVNKIALTGVHTKMVVYENHSCAPFGFEQYGVIVKE